MIQQEPFKVDEENYKICKPSSTNIRQRFFKKQLNKYEMPIEISKIIDDFPNEKEQGQRLYFLNQMNSQQNYTIIYSNKNI